MALSGAQWEKLLGALTNAFPSTDELTLMLRLKCDVRLDDIVAPGPLKVVVFRVIEDAEAKGWTTRLIAGAREYNPGNPELAAVAGELGLALAAPPGPSLETLIDAHRGFLNPVAWREQLGLL